jgi:hypothetical protein
VTATFALAGGAHGVKYPAKTLYENAAKSPSSLHDVTLGSNGECTLPFDEETGQPGCTAAQEAETSCSSHLICLAGPGYDGPSGLGTPDGIAAFEPPAGAANEESSGERPPSTPSPAPATTPATTSTVSKVTTSSVTAPPTVQLTGLALTVNALIALNKSHPKIAALAFTFTLNLTVHVHTALEERVGRHGHQHWKTMGHSLTIAAVSGRNTRRLGGTGVLSPGAYRLTLTPAGGASRALNFKIG